MRAQVVPADGIAIAPAASPDALDARAGAENFPVASRILPAAVRSHLLAIYGFARLVDDIGDEGSSVPLERLDRLDHLERELDLVFEGRPTHPAMVRLARTVARCGLPEEPFRLLIEANRWDQTRTRYETFEDLAAYCRRSADPIGRLVLGVLGMATPNRVALSDAVCTGLQLVEHCQDVAEDLGRGRIYLPLEDLERFDVTEADLAAPTAAEAVRRLLAFETERARSYLEAGTPLAATLPLRAGWAVAGFAGGGLAALDAIDRADHDVLGARPRPPAGRAAVTIAATFVRAFVPGVRRDAGGSGGERSAGDDRDRRLASAYAVCGSITRARAANFYYGIRLLPPDKRRALSAVYAFARRIDDVGDGPLPAGAKLERLRFARRSLGDRSPTDPVLVAIADVLARFCVPDEALGDLIDGVEMDVRGTRYERFDDLVVYCRRVAGSIGRLSAAIFGAWEPAAASRMADDLGVAMQLTNILRDVVEDRSLGRTYLPTEDLAAFGLTPEDLTRPSAAGRALVRFEAARARAWFARGLRLMPSLDARSAACVGAMTGIYRRLLDRIEADPAAVFRGRVALSTGDKVLVSVRSLATRGRR
jgi:phytoene synthase